jgi:beta-lactamase superfamily II metal-dependent hydrolase
MMKIRRKSMINRFFLVFMMLFFHVASLADYKNGAYIYNVGHGSFAIVKSGKNAVVIDCGYTKRPVQKLDQAVSDADAYINAVFNDAVAMLQNDTHNVALVISHNHADHKNKLDRLVVPDPFDQSKTIPITFNSGMFIGNNADVTLNTHQCIHKTEHSFDVGVGLDKIHVELKPSSGAGTTANKYNIMTKVTVGGKNYLFMGDAEYTYAPSQEAYNKIESGDNEGVTDDALEKVQDKQLADEGAVAVVSAAGDGFFEKINLYVAPHHGSATNSSMKWLDLVTTSDKRLPITVISCKTHPYNMPSHEYCEKYKDEPPTV